jgi:hypothetical protein
MRSGLRRVAAIVKIELKEPILGADIDSRVRCVGGEWIVGIAGINETGTAGT